MAGASSKTLNLVRSVMKYNAEGAGFDRVLDKVKVVSAGDGKCTCELTLDDSHVNRMGTLHGGLTATMVDIVSTMALLTSQRATTGVSLDLSVSYIKAAKPGQDILVAAETLKAGKSFAFLTVDVTNKDDGQLLAQGKHTKYIT